MIPRRLDEVLIDWVTDVKSAPLQHETPCDHFHSVYGAVLQESL